jgi:hypothetical protein
MRAPGRTGLGGLGVGVLLIAAVLLAPPSRPRGATLVLGPVRDLAAQWNWIRFQRARLAGESVRALEFAERAIDIDPGASTGWQALADHLALDLASVAREPDVPRRRALFEAALSILDRGRARCDEPAALDFGTALLCLLKAEQDPLVHPDGSAGLRRLAHMALERAAQAGHKAARELLSLIDDPRAR